MLLDFHCASDDLMKKVQERNLFIETEIPLNLRSDHYDDKNKESFK
jgi:hypothetical protein